MEKFFTIVSSLTKTQWLILYVFVASLFGFFSMEIDKSRAKKDKWRTPEKKLFFFALLGGSIGSIVGMYVFHHKTKHWYFVIGMPLILIAQIALVYYLRLI